MNKMRIKWATLLLTCAIVVTPTFADDIELFFNTSATGVGDPLVMFSIDYRPNLTSTICNIPAGGGVEDCGWDDAADSSDDKFYFGYNNDAGEAVSGFYDEFTDTDEADGTVTFLELLRAALRYVLSQEEVVGKVRVGLMLNHDYINKCEGNVTEGCSNGGYIAMGFTKTGLGTTVSGENVLDLKLGAIPDPQGFLSHSNQGKELYYEFHQYLTGGPVWNGHVGYTDYGDACHDDNLNDSDPTSCGGDDSDVLPAPVAEPDAHVSWDTSIETVDDEGVYTYISPFTDTTLACSSVYAINFMFGVVSQDANSDDEIERDLTGIASKLTYPAIIEWMYEDAAGADRDLSDTTEGNQNVTSYFLYNGNVQKTMDGYAIAGGTGQAIEVSEDPKAMVESLISAFKEILRQNSTFEAPAVSVNSYTRLTHRDELFYALFSPEETANWPGNLKKYTLGSIQTDTDGDGIVDAEVVRVEDKDGNEAVDDSSGVFKATACSYWTDCSVDRDNDGFADADGDIVHWGGAAEEIKSDGSRVVYTDDGSSLVPLTAANVTHAQLGISTDTSTDATDSDACIDADADGNIDCIADMDDDNDVDSSDHDALRDQLLAHLNEQTLGDPIHARPSVIEYDDDASNQGATPDLTIAASTNEGFFHLLNAADGTEYSAYIPSDLLPLIKRVNGPSSPGGTGSTRFNTYGLDGSPVVRTYDSDSDGLLNDGDDVVHAFLTQRRGGRNIYALNIRSRTSPGLLWKIIGGSGGFTNLGQTWSEPILATLKGNGTNGADLPVLVFGGGYDPAQDSTYQLADSYGNSIFIVNALTGAKVWEISSSGSDLDISDMLNSIPANVKALDLDEDGYLDRIYAVDVVGRIFRIDFSNTGSATTIAGGGRVASLFDTSPACAAGAPAAGVAASCQRRFYNSPDVALMTEYSISPYAQIAVGSGYRAHPVTVTGIQDRFYVLFDENALNTVATGNYSTEYQWTEDNLVNATDISLADPESGDTAYQTASSNIQAALLGADVHGWYLNMEGEQEKVLSNSVTVLGKIVFTTYLRDSSQVTACEPNLGQGRIYIIDAFNGLPVADLFNGMAFAGSTVTPTKVDRFKDLKRAGIPSDPLVVFRESDDGKVVPTVVVSTELPLPPDLFGSNNYVKTWWINED